MVQLSKMTLPSGSQVHNSLDQQANGGKKPLPELSIRKNKLTTLYLSDAYDASEVESPVTEGEMLVLARSLQSLSTKPPRNMNWKEK